LEEYLQKNRSTHLFLFMTTNFTNMQPAEFLDDIKRNFPGLQIEVAGNSFRGMDREVNSRTRIFSNVEDFISHLGT
jgi:FAD synthase